MLWRFSGLPGGMWQIVTFSTASALAYPPSSPVLVTEGARGRDAPASPLPAQADRATVAERSTAAQARHFLFMFGLLTWSVARG
jgi:hypothetical protein